MKKILLLLTLTLILLATTSFTTIASAKSYEELVYEDNVKILKSERTDEYALDYYKQSTAAEKQMFKDKAKEIVAGLTNDYDKAEAIFYWVIENVCYSYEKPEGLTGIDEYTYGTCETFAFITQTLCQAAGLPAKTVGGAVIGSVNGHDWNRVYADGRWIHVDATWGEFDLTVKEWSETRSLGTDLKRQDEEAWDGALCFFDFTNYKTLKEIKNFPLNGIVTSTYGFDINDLYLDVNYTKPFKLNTMKVHSWNNTIFVKPSSKAKTYKVTFDSNGGTALKAVTVKAKATIAKPTAPTRKGYKFVAWYKDAKLTKKWDFSKDKVSAKTTLYAGWVKTYKVTYKSNGSIKEVTVKNKATLEQPTAPKRTGYKFAGWYKDSKLTKKWDFSKDKVTANTILYAGWKKAK